MNWKPEEREGAQPEQEEADKVSRVGPRRSRKSVASTVVAVVVPRGPNRSYHEVNTCASDPALDSIPMGEKSELAMFPVPSTDQFTYQMHAITALFRTGHKLPQIPKLERHTTGNAMWYLAAIRPVRQTKKAAIVYPIQTVSQDCHQDMPATMLELAIIHVFMLKLSEIQKAT